MPKGLPVCFVACLISITAIAEEQPGAVAFRKSIRPILENYCFDCHADGAHKGNVAFDEFKSDQAALQNRDLWLKALKMLEAGLMPPAKKPRPTNDERAKIVTWIKRDVFDIDPQNPDPGRVTVRRLNRVEYQNTIRDLMGVEFDAQTEFPPDDTGFGFDNMGDVLTLPPMLLEKYLAAANKIITKAVPTVGAVVPEKIIPGRSFQSGGEENNSSASENFSARRKYPGARSLSYYAATSVSNTFEAQFEGKYQLAIDLSANERFVDNVFDYNKCRLIFKVDGEKVSEEQYAREGGKPFHYELEKHWQAGPHELVFELQPLTPDQKQVRSLTLQIISVTVRGPMEPQHWSRPADYERFFPKPVPKDAKERRDYAGELLGKFAGKAFRRPADARTVDRLVKLAEGIYTQKGKTFEGGIAQAMVAVLASPRFLFREERAETSAGGASLPPANKGVSPASEQRYPLLDEYSLASRLSYFLWSSMPDDELMRQAEQRTLRKNFSAQLQRMLHDSRSKAFIGNFTGQWLRARDIESVPIEARSVLAREESSADPDFERNRRRFRELRDKPEDQLTPGEQEELAKFRATFRRNRDRTPRADLTGELRYAMRMETEKVFAYVLREDRDLAELLDSDYTFLNERLAKHYGITNVFGDEMRLVKLPADSPRGGVLTEGTILAATSNPTRTSPVKRGVFILDSILGTPVPPPPPDIPPLEDATKKMTNRAPSLRETLAAHRENALCGSCHNRMDPLGLAMENFNAMGMWRQSEFNKPIDSTGRLITGEEFSNVKELKQILVKNHAEDFYRNLTEKVLMYAIGRGLEYYDVETVDKIVERLEKNGGKPSVLLAGIVESAPFQKTRGTPMMAQGTVKQ